MHLHAPVQRTRLRHDFDSSTIALQRTCPVYTLILFTKQNKTKKAKKQKFNTNTGQFLYT